MLDIMYRAGLRGKATVHGFRAVASTVLNESGLFMPDWIEMQLAHMPRGVRGVYNAARYLSHRRKMMEWWAQYLDAAEAAAPLTLPTMAGPLREKAKGLEWFQKSWQAVGASIQRAILEARHPTARRPIRSCFGNVPSLIIR